MALFHSLLGLLGAVAHTLGVSERSRARVAKDATDALAKFLKEDIAADAGAKCVGQAGKKRVLEKSGFLLGAKHRYT